MKTLKIFPLLLVLLMAACTKEPSDPPCDEPKTCELKGKFEAIACGWGLYESYWIRLDNGTLLQPCQSDISIDINRIYNGMPIELSYYGVKNSSCPESPLNCFAALPEHETVRLTCIKLLDEKPKEEPNCRYSNMGVLYDWHNKLDGCGWIIKLNNGDILEVTDSDMEGRNLDNDTPVLFDYIETGNGSACMVGLPVHIKCMKVANVTTQ